MLLYDEFTFFLEPKWKFILHIYSTTGVMIFPSNDSIYVKFNVGPSLVIQFFSLFNPLWKVLFSRYKKGMKISNTIVWQKGNHTCTFSLLGFRKKVTQTAWKVEKPEKLRLPLWKWKERGRLLLENNEFLTVIEKLLRYISKDQRGELGGKTNLTRWVCENNVGGFFPEKKEGGWWLVGWWRTTHREWSGVLFEALRGSVKTSLSNKLEYFVDVFVQEYCFQMIKIL